MSPLVANLLSGGALLCAVMVVVSTIRFKNLSGYLMPLAFLSFGALLLSIRFELGIVWYCVFSALVFVLLSVDFSFRAKMMHSAKEGSLTP